MNSIEQIFQNSALVTAAISWAAAQFIKIILVLIKEHRFDFTRITGSGGMPSSHSSFTCSLATAVGFLVGFDSVAFAITAAFAFIVMYDATGVRRSAGHQAKILNRIIEKIGKEDITETGKKLKELLGHTPVQVFAGALLGIAISIFRYVVL
ncbi:MAG: divergent PAP2 family protein [Oscillospiraceae bacterium]|nr:divergent PAP2 family protein [Oscillospiraceae bacterium]